MAIPSRSRRNSQFVIDFVEIALQEQLLDVFSRVGPLTPLFHEVIDGILSREGLVLRQRVNVLLEMIKRGFLTGVDRCSRIPH